MSTAKNSAAISSLYANDEGLRLRNEIHERYSVPQVDFAAWAISSISWRGNESILDIGCGPGIWYPRLKEKMPDITYYGLDLYPSMVRKHPAAKTLCIADGQHLPYPDNSFDVVMANHMLFHVEDIDRAVDEFRRVLKPDGLLMVSTNSSNNMPELQILLRRAITLLVPPGTAQIQVPTPPSDAFTLELGTRKLSRYFYAVVRFDLPGLFVFPGTDPIMDYLESTRPIREPQLPDGVSWDEVMLIVREQVNRLLDHFGEIVITKLAGLLVATDQGNFISDYLEHEAKSKEQSGD